MEIFCRQNRANIENENDRKHRLQHGHLYLLHILPIHEKKNVILEKNYKSVICCKCRYERNMHTHLFTQFKSPQVRTPENIGQLIKIWREDYFGACWRRCVVRGGTPLEVARSVRLARGRDYLDVTRSGFLVRGGRRHSLSLW